MSKITLTGKDLTLEQIAAICRDHAEGELAEEAKQKQHCHNYRIK